MVYDQILVLSLAICVLAIPPMFSAYVDSRPHRSAAIMMMIGGVLLVVALTQKPGGYRFADIPHAVTRVIAGIIR